MTLIEGAGNCPGTIHLCEKLQGLVAWGRMLAQRRCFQPRDSVQRRLPEGGPSPASPTTHLVFGELLMSVLPSPLKNPPQLPSLELGFLNLTCPPDTESLEALSSLDDYFHLCVPATSFIPWQTWRVGRGDLRNLRHEAGR